MNLESLAQRNSLLMVVIDDFSAKSKHWCSQDSTNFEGSTIENVISQFGQSKNIGSQIIKEATHVLGSSSSCIDLIFTTQSNWWLNLVFTRHCIQTVTIKLYSQNLIYKYITRYHTHEKSGTINKQILNSSDGQLLKLIGIEPFSALMLTRKFLSSATLY